MTCFILDLDDTLVNTTRDLGGDQGLVTKLTLVEGAEKFLEKYGQKSIVLSVGSESYQQSKITVVGIREKIDRLIIVSTFAYKAKVIKKFAELAPQAEFSVVVVGDRIDQEIMLGNQLGLVTVRMRLKEGKYSGYMPPSTCPEQRPDYTVENFFELMQLPICSK